MEKIFERLIDSVRVFRPHWHSFKVNDLKHYCAASCADTETETETFSQILANNAFFLLLFYILGELDIWA